MGVGKVVQELHGMLKLVFVIMVATIYVCCLAIGEVISVIEMVVDEKDDREVHKVGMVFSILAAEIIQVLDSIAWARCASGNVFFSDVLTKRQQLRF